MHLAGCRKIARNKTADQLARAEFGHPLTGLERT
jgi:hypothetical protein